MSLLGKVLTPSVRSIWDSYVEAANQLGHAYLGLVWALVPAAAWGPWGASAGFVAPLIWEVGHLLRDRGQEREGARRWDAVKDVVSHVAGIGAAAVGGPAMGLGPALWMEAFLLGGLVWAGAMGIVWQLTDRNAR